MRHAQRQFDCKTAALTDCASHGDASTMSFGHVFHNRQSQSNALCLTSQFGAPSIEPLENSFVVGGWNAAALVLNPEEKAWGLGVMRVPLVQRALGRVGPESRAGIRRWRRGSMG